MKPFSSAGVAPSVEAFDKLVNSMVAEFLRNSRVLAGDVEAHVSISLPPPPPDDPDGVTMSLWLLLPSLVQSFTYLPYKTLPSQASVGTVLEARSSGMNETRASCPTPTSKLFTFGKQKTYITIQPTEVKLRE